MSDNQMTQSSYVPTRLKCCMGWGFVTESGGQRTVHCDGCGSYSHNDPKRKGPFTQEQTCVYRVWSGKQNSSSLLYIGVTNNFPRRMAEHQRADVWWRNASSFDVETFDNRLDALAAEARAIQSEFPEFNFQYSNKCWQSDDSHCVILDLSSWGDWSEYSTWLEWYLAKDVVNHLVRFHGSIAGLSDEIEGPNGELIQVSFPEGTQNLILHCEPFWFVASDLPLVSTHWFVGESWASFLKPGEFPVPESLWPELWTGSRPLQRHPRAGRLL